VQGCEVQLATATLLLFSLQATIFWGVGNGGNEQKTVRILSYVSHSAEWKATNLGGIPCTENSHHRREKVNNCLYLFMCQAQVKPSSCTGKRKWY
jgi:hypothetical protein